MNPCQTRQATAVRPAREGAETALDPQCRAAFDRVLRGKADAHDEERGGQGDAQGLAPAAGVLAERPSRTSTVASPAAAGAVEAPRHAVVEAMCAAAIGEAPVLASGGSTENSWDVSLHEPRGVAVELRATRSGPTSGGAWTLTVATPALDPAALARHAPRLSDRLRARARVATHLRIGDDKETP
jgi:hypothetical protein